MDLTWLEMYLILINIIGFVLFAVNVALYTYTADRQIDSLLTICAIMGGSLGIVIGIFLIDRKALKENMMSRVFVFCVLIIQIVMVLWLKGYHSETLNFRIFDLFMDHKLLIAYLIVINVVAFIMFGIDKLNAINHRTRIRIITLLMLAFIGGSIGGLIAMYAFRHKTQIDYFTVGVPLILLMQIVVIFYLMNIN